MHELDYDGGAMPTADDLREFEEEIAQEFATGSIKAPIHLSGGNEERLIRIFSTLVSPSDWILCGWRSHYHCLLKGVPREELRKAILDGRSVALCFPGYNILCSGIMAGIAPIAVGIADGLRRTGREGWVWCFVGDMTAESGIFHEAEKYAGRHDLPITWIVEDNGLSVMTPTQQSWGPEPHVSRTVRYPYKLERPHSGIGKWVRF